MKDARDPYELGISNIVGFISHELVWSYHVCNVRTALMYDSADVRAALTHVSRFRTGERAFPSSLPS